jgi:sulfur-carrier protein adenylyltransferase/sulfurtransferase
MSRRYIILAALLVLLGLVLVFLPMKQTKNELDPKGLLVSIEDPSRFLSTDLVTSRLIDQDPSFILVDVRPVSEYESYALPGALNIPLDSLLNPGYRDLLHTEIRDIVFYSNSDILSDQAWNICQRMACKNTYVMEGGLNHWFKTIMMVEPPLQTDPSQAQDLYLFRKAARQYFGGGSQIEAPKVEAEAIKIVPVKKKKAVEGGC